MKYHAWFRTIPKGYKGHFARDLYTALYKAGAPSGPFALRAMFPMEARGVPRWIEDKDFTVFLGTGCSYFRVPSDSGGFNAGDSRSLPRHNKRVNVDHWDGHAGSMRNKAIGYYRSNGSLAQVGDPFALWDKK